MSGFELLALLRGWNDTSRDYPRDACLAALFDAQAAACPDSPAIEWQAGSLTYAELQTQANRLAHSLLQAGLPHQGRVALALDRGPGMVIAMLAVLKAGGIYVPLDPVFPLERLRFMLQDAQATVLLAQGDLAQALAAPALFVFDPEDAAIAAQPPIAPPISVRGADLAYIMYTSGSTGVPKGSAIPQRAITRLVTNTDYVHFAPSDRVAQASNMSFDAATFEVWGALLNGACLVQIQREDLLDPARLATWLAQQRISVLFLTTSLFNAIATQQPDAFKSIDQVVTGGEAASPDAMRRVLQAGPPGRLVNGYGPTESCTFAVCGLVEQVPPDARSVPIGRPIANTTAFILDEQLQPVPVGEMGELYLGGDGLADGYWNRPDLTAERFINTPPILSSLYSQAEGDVSQSRLYRTGDLARWLPDGQIDCLGRLDNQVKLRGFRIEMEEIESLLHQSSQVAQAVVILREDTPGDKRLVAYLVAVSGSQLDLNAIRQSLQAKLPEYMLPSAMLVLPALPLTPNGKLDRQALPVPPKERRASAPYRAPQGELQLALARVWGAVLGIEQVGVEDDFFELGGHSLAFAQVAARCREQLGLELSLRQMFLHPTIASLSASMEQIPAPATVSLPPVSPADRSQPIPLSYAQEQVWVLKELAPGNLAYNSQMCVRFHGPLDHTVLQRTLSEIVRRHEIFRTSFELVDGRPCQLLHDPWQVPLPIQDLSALTAEQQRFEITRVETETFQRPFDTRRLPLIRWTLLRLDTDEHLLIQVEHHFIHDGWSFGLLMGEIKALYPAFLAGETPVLPPPSIQFADFAVWQRRLVESGTLDSQLDFWRERLAGSPPVLELPSDRPRPAQRSFNGGAHRMMLSAEKYAQIKHLSLEHGATFFVTLLAAFKALLFRYTGQRDLLVGAGFANRRLPEIEQVVGMIVQPVVLRSQLPPDAPFSDFLALERDTFSDAYAQQDLPFGKLVEALQPGRSLSYNPIFQVLFSFHDSPVPEMDFAGLRAEIDYRQNDSAKFDLNIVVIPRAEQLLGHSARQDDQEVLLIWEYDADLFDADTIARMAGHYRVLLDAILDDPDCPVERLPLLTAAERRQLLDTWNDTTRPLPEPTCIHSVFEAQVDLSPQSTALVFRDQSMTYAELNERANRLAHFLRRRGVGPGSCVGLCIERSLDLVTGMLAILKAGGAYLPLDPNYPAERLAFMLQDTAAPLVLIQDHLRSCLPASPAVQLALDSDASAWAGESGDNPELLNNGDHLAYIMYTSGSSGWPKGVLVPHRGVVRLVRGADYIPFTTDQVFLQFAPTSFDAATFEIWGALLNGARLVVYPDPSGGATLAELEHVIESYSVNTLWLTAGLFHQVVELRPSLISRLRYLLAGGDILSPALVRRALDHAGECQLVNGYGPTETTTFACCYPIPKDYDPALPVPIGRPIVNTQVYIVDELFQPVPPGVPGELLIGGAGLAREYLNQPELTAKKFILRPGSLTLHQEVEESEGERLYRTGDRARWLPDGRLEFLGRLDGQIKLRGFRIELGEIETALLSHPALSRAAVIVRQDGAAGKRLLAYVVLRDGRQANQDELREHLVARLPEYMLPAAIVFLPELPLTPNGKLDRQALPDPPVFAPSARSGSDQAPLDVAVALTPSETRLALLWQELLNLPAISPQDDFFALGGHSLLAIRLFARMESDLNVHLPLAALFNDPTLRGLARQMDLAQQHFPHKDLEWSPLVLMRPGDGMPFFLVHGYGGGVVGYTDLARLLPAGPAIYGLQAAGLQQGSGQPDASIEAMAQRYLVALRQVQPRGPYRLGGYCIGGVVAFEMARQLEAEGEQTSLLALLEGYAPGWSQQRTAFFQAGRLLAIWRNLPYWLADYSSMNLRQVGQRFNRSLARLTGKIPGGERRPEDIVPDDLSAAPQKLIELMNAHLQAQAAYLPQPVNCAVDLFVARSATLRKAFTYSLDPTHGWAGFAPAGVRHHQVEGSHRNLHLMPHVPSLAVALGKLLV